MVPVALLLFFLISGICYQNFIFFFSVFFAVGFVYFRLIQPSQRCPTLIGLTIMGAILGTLFVPIFGDVGDLGLNGWVIAEASPKKWLFPLIVEEYFVLHPKDASPKIVYALQQFFLGNQFFTVEDFFSYYRATHPAGNHAETFYSLLQRFSYQWNSIALELYVSPAVRDDRLLHQYLNLTAANKSDLLKIYVVLSEHGIGVEPLEDHLVMSYILKVMSPDLPENKLVDIHNFMIALDRRCRGLLDRVATNLTVNRWVDLDVVVSYLAGHQRISKFFLKELIHYMVTLDVDARDLQVIYLMEHLDEINTDFINRVFGQDFFEYAFKNDPYYPFHRTNLISYEVNSGQYDNWVNTNQAENAAPLVLFVTIAFVLLMSTLLGLVASRSNVFIFLLFSELYIFSSIFLLIALSYYLELPQGQIYALLLLGVAAAEAAVGLGLLLVVYRIRGHLTFK